MTTPQDTIRHDRYTEYGTTRHYTQYLPTMRLSLLLSLSSAFATTALAKPLRARQADIRSCVAQVLGEDADERIVVPEDETYTDARIGEHIQ